jgi:4-hydroxyphenylacetate 3-monooxygenase
MRRGREYLAALRDGRVVLVNGERIDDIVAHAGFAEAARTVAALYDQRPDCANGAVHTTDDRAFNAAFLQPRSRSDLERRRAHHARIADATFGLFGRSPDHVASLITGLSMAPNALNATGDIDYAGRLADYYEEVRARDAFIAYAVLPGSRASPSHRTALTIVSETGRGIVLRGRKALATAAVLADEIWVGNLQPIADLRDDCAVTCALPCATPGLTLLARVPFARPGDDDVRPLTRRFDESDAVLEFDDVEVPWERVFVHDDAQRSSEIYLRSPAHALANHQSAVRSLAKVRLMVGLADRLATVTGAIDAASVRALLGRMAALEATLAALVDAQVDQCENWPGEYVSPNRRYVYAALNWCQETFPFLTECLRELSGAGVFKHSAGTGGTDQSTADLFRLSWDLVGSEFAGRQQLYERFYAGPPFVVRGHSYREARWDELRSAVARVLEKPSAT